MDLPTTDPFNGLYMASYGEHGPELLRLYRETIGGTEVVVAQKLTGACPAGAGPGALNPALKGTPGLHLGPRPIQE